MHDVYALLALPGGEQANVVHIARLSRKADAAHMVERYKRRGIVACYMPEDGGEVVFNRNLQPANHSRFIGSI
jgi:hypothetical protein